MTKHLRVLAALGVLAAMMHGCGDATPAVVSSPLTGRWTASILPQPGATYSLTLSFNTGGTVTYWLSGVGMCTGSLTYTGLTWATTATTLTTAGTAQCAGMGITCPGTAGTATCMSTGPAAGTCTYALSNNNATLVLSGCVSPSDVLNATYTRAS